MKNILVFLTFAASTLSSVEPPKVAPEIDEDKASVSVVVATSTPGDSLPAPKECLNPNVICMRYPHWYSATAIAQVYGMPLTGQFAVTTYTHYGQPKKDDASAPRLMLIFTQNKQSVMPAYSSARLTRRKDGEYFIVLNTTIPIHWLPCDVANLQEPIIEGDFPNGIDIPSDDYYVEHYPDLFTLRRGKAIPRFGISVTSLGKQLERTQPKIKDFNCEISDES